MNDNLINRFFLDRQQRYKDYALYACRNAGIEEHWEDLYMEVVTNCFERSESIEHLISDSVDMNDPRNKRIAKLYAQNHHKFPLCQMDLYMIGVIKLNAISPRAPYRWKFLHPMPSGKPSNEYIRKYSPDEEEQSTINQLLDQGNHIIPKSPIPDDVDFSRLDLEDDEYIETDPTSRIIEQTNVIRQELKRLGIGPLGQKVFAFKFLDGNSLKDWPGSEDKKEIYKLYRKTMNLLKSKLNPDYTHTEPLELDFDYDTEEADNKPIEKLYKAIVTQRKAKSDGSVQMGLFNC